MKQKEWPIAIRIIRECVAQGMNNIKTAEELNARGPAPKPGSTWTNNKVCTFKKRHGIAKMRKLPARRSTPRQDPLPTATFLANLAAASSPNVADDSLALAELVLKASLPKAKKIEVLQRLIA